MNNLNDVIKKLTCDPGKFDLLAKPLVEEIYTMLSIEEIVENAVMLIIDQVCNIALIFALMMSLPFLSVIITYC